MKANSRPEDLASKVQLLRIRVAAAEIEFKDIQERAREAKRRHKEAKRIARRARKYFKRSKEELAELKQALTKVELKLRRAGGRAPVAKRAKAGIDVGTINGRLRPVWTAAGDASERVLGKRTAIRRSATPPEAAIDGVATDLESSKSQILNRSFEDHE